MTVQDTILSPEARAELESAVADMREARAVIDSALHSAIGESPLTRNGALYAVNEMTHDDLIIEINEQVREVRDLVVNHVPVIAEKMQSPMARMAIRTMSSMFKG